LLQNNFFFSIFIQAFPFMLSLPPEKENGGGKK